MDDFISLNYLKKKKKKNQPTKIFLEKMIISIGRSRKRGKYRLFVPGKVRICYFAKFPVRSRSQARRTL